HLNRLPEKRQYELFDSYYLMPSLMHFEYFIYNMVRDELNLD
ncbi:unnamed protein product, partial [marine sediment metagenome]